MTAARQKRKRHGCEILAAGAVMFALASGIPASFAATTEAVVVDWHTGLAIGGYDPVAFFADGKARLGSQDFELPYAGAVWRFCNIGDREAFMSRPDIYMPRFGGYDPVGVASGAAVAGNPTVWLIYGEQLFLFYDQARREAFGADPQGILAKAERKWPAVLHTLSP